MVQHVAAYIALDGNWQSDMGAAIHLWVEIRSGNVWQFAHDYTVEKSGNESWIHWNDPFDEPNYFLFALLAGVRNTDHQFQPIFPIRGVPPDISEIGMRIVKEWEGDGHTHSWVSATELLQHPWQDRVPLRGFVTSEVAAAWRNHGLAPNEWERDSELIEEVPLNEWERDSELIERLPLRWTDTKLELCGNFVTEFLPTLSSYGHPDATRVLFFFDN